MNNYILTKKPLTNGKFKYTVTDETGHVISTRNSSRHYVACTIRGHFYFGRIDLIGKGDHGRAIRACVDPESLHVFTSIAYLNLTLNK